MAKKTTDPENLDAPPDDASTTEPRPPQGITPRRLDDLHRIHRGSAGVPGVRRLDPASLKTPEGYDPFLRFPGGAVIQVRADHAAELLECDELTGGESRHRLATEEEIATEKDRQQKSLRR